MAEDPTQCFMVHPVEFTVRIQEGFIKIKQRVSRSEGNCAISRTLNRCKSSLWCIYGVNIAAHWRKISYHTFLRNHYITPRGGTCPRPVYHRAPRGARQGPRLDRARALWKYFLHSFHITRQNVLHFRFVVPFACRFVFLSTDRESWNLTVKLRSKQVMQITES